ESQDQRMHEPKGVHGVKSHTSDSASVLGYDQVVVVGIGIGDTAAAGCYIVEPAFIERLERYREGALPCHLLGIDELVAATKLTGGNDILDIRDHHRDDCPGLENTCDFANHSDLHYLRFNLPEARLQTSLTQALRNQYPGRSHERIDDIADPEHKLL